MATKVQLSEQQFVVFELDGESYGVDIGRVQEIDRMQKITTVPEVPPYVEGIINLRGRVTPIVNLRARLALPAAAETAQSRIVVVISGDIWVGLVVDAVSQVLRIPAAAVEPPPAMLSLQQTGFLRGVAKLPDRLVILLDLDQLVEQVANHIGMAELATA